MMTLQSLFISSIFVLSFKILSNISFGGSFKAPLVPTCKIMYSGLCRKIGFIFSCMSLTLAPENLFTLTLCFWDSRSGCKPKTIESPAVHIVPFGHGQSSLLLDTTLSFISVSLIQIGGRMDSFLSRVFFFLLNYLYTASICHVFFFRNSIICSLIDLQQIGFFDKGSLDILSISNVKISPLSTNFVIFNSSGLA